MLSEKHVIDLIYKHSKIFRSPSTGGSAVWGAISGTLSNQTDLQSALNTKLDSLTVNATGLTYSSNALILTTGYVIPTTTEESNWNNHLLNTSNPHQTGFSNLANYTGLDEMVDDRVSALMIAGNVSSWTYVDASNTLKVDINIGSGLSVSGGQIIHADTSTQTSINLSGSNVIQDLTLDTYGHITAYGSVDVRSLFSGNAPIVYTSATGVISLTQTGDILGTTNQVKVSGGIDKLPGTMNVTLSLPQDIHSGASPTFVTVKLSGLTDGKIPYHISDASGLSDSILAQSGTEIDLSGSFDVSDSYNMHSNTYSQFNPYIGFYISKDYSTFSKLAANELHVKSFIADLEQALVGSQIICKSVAKLYQKFNEGIDTYLYVEEIAGFTGQVFATGDYIRIRNISMTGSGGANSLSVTEVWIQVTYFDRNSTNKYQRYTYTYKSGSHYTTYSEGTLALDYGVSGNGILERVAIGISGNKPYDRIATWTTAPYTDLTTINQIGDLSGVQTTNFGIISSGIFGTYTNRLYAETNVYVAGNLWALTGGIGGTYVSPKWVIDSNNIQQTLTNSKLTISAENNGGTEFNYGKNTWGQGYNVGWDFGAGNAGNVWMGRVPSSHSGAGDTGWLYSTERYGFALHWYDGSELFEISTDGTAGKAGLKAYIAGWNFDFGKFYKGTDIVLDAANKKVAVNNDAIKMYYTSAADYGIKDSAGKFQLGSINKISGWTFDTSKLSNSNTRLEASASLKGLAVSGTILSNNVDLLKVGKFTFGSMNVYTANLSFTYAKTISVGWSKAFTQTATSAYPNDSNYVFASVSAGTQIADFSWLISNASEFYNKFIRIAFTFKMPAGINGTASQPNVILKIVNGATTVYQEGINGYTTGEAYTKSIDKTFLCLGSTIQVKVELYAALGFYNHLSFGNGTPLSSNSMNINTYVYYDSTPITEVNDGNFRIYDSGGLRMLNYDSTGLKLKGGFDIDSWTIKENPDTYALEFWRLGSKVAALSASGVWS